jgi:predicted nucleotidyltransferase
MPSLASTSLDPTERRVVDRLVELLRDEFAEGLESVWLYGSRARGEPPTDESDVDLLVVARGDRHRNLDRAIELLWGAAKAEGADPLVFSVKVWDPARIADRRAIDSFFMRELDRDKIVLAGKP